MNEEITNKCIQTASALVIFGMVKLSADVDNPAVMSVSPADGREMKNGES